MKTIFEFLFGVNGLFGNTIRETICVFKGHNIKNADLKVPIPMPMFDIFPIKDWVICQRCGKIFPNFEESKK
jgi:hypothetical protein